MGKKSCDYIESEFNSTELKDNTLQNIVAKFVARQQNEQLSQHLENEMKKLDNRHRLFMHAFSVIEATKKKLISQARELNATD